MPAGLAQGTETFLLPIPPVPLHQLPGAFRFFHFGMNHVQVVSAIQQVRDAYPEEDVGYWPTFRAPFVGVYGFPINDTIQATVHFEMGAQGNALQGIRVFITKTRGEALNEKNAQAALVAQLDWMSRAFGGLTLESDNEQPVTSNMEISAPIRSLPQNLLWAHNALTVRPMEQKFLQSMWVVKGTMHRERPKRSKDGVAASKENYHVEIVYVAPSVADTLAQKM